MYLLLPFFLTLIYLFKKLFRIGAPHERLHAVNDKEHDFAIIVTAHQETKFLFPLVDSVLKQQYQRYQVYVVADDCDISTLRFPDARVTILKPEQPLNAKIKSIDYALSKFVRHHDAMVILDADNLIHPAFLSVMNTFFQKGFRAVQSEFKAKNTDSDYERMDAMGDMFNFFLEREMRMELGISAAIWGSGITMDTALYKQVVYKNFLGGFDKKLQAHIVRTVPVIGFAKEAILYDEKITSGKSLENQRTRWLNAQFKYMSESWKVFLLGWRKLNFNLVYFGFIILRPPLFMIIGFGILCCLLNIFIQPALAIVWLGVFFLFITSFIAIIWIKSRDRRYFKTFLRMPLFFMRQVLAFTKMKKANKYFIKTEHKKVVFIHDILHK
ncbi:MAG: glycosyltransferase family 2 protein [Flavisolibacter sp.]